MKWKDRFMKYISFAIPCYNSQEYMAHAIETILTGGEDVEIIIVNDGSKDNTSKDMVTQLIMDLPMPRENILKL